MQQASLFDAPPRPVLASAGSWIEALLSGSLMVTLCVLGVGLFGFLLLGGHVPLKRGLLLVLGAFVALGAPTLALGLMGAGIAGESPAAPQLADWPAQEAQPMLPPAAPRRHAGASLRRD